MIFDVKMLDSYGLFRRNSWYVAGGHNTETPAALTYTSVVSRYLVRIALTFSSFDGLYILACDIQNAYLTAQCREKIWTVTGPEFGSGIGKIFIINIYSVMSTTYLSSPIVPV